MRFRIAIWAATGALVVVFWSLYLSATHLSRYALTWLLVDLTMPIALARHYRFAMSVNAVLLVNAATYALVGTVVETTWRHYQHRRQLIAN